MGSHISSIVPILISKTSPLLSSPLGFVRSGYFSWYSSVLLTRKNDGYYWSTFPYSQAYSRSLHFYSSYLNPQNGDNKGRGFAVRCVSRSPLLSSPLGFVRSGYFNWGSSTLNYRRFNGFYWSAFPNSQTYSRNLVFGASYLYPLDGYGKGNGFAVRCVSR